MSTITLPAAMQPLFTPSRYKVLYGGRGGAKSHSIAKALLTQAAAEPHRVLCAREFQASISDSVHKLLSDQIRELELDDFYEVQRTTVVGRNGSEFLFAGLRHNIASIKSFEGCTRVWVEEAQTVSKASWDVLIPTIRKPNSEIWISFNPELATDETYQRFVANPPTDAIVMKVNWSDNPWFPAVLRQEMEDLKARDYDSWLTTWEGHCRQTLDGAIYAEQIRKATANDQFTRVPVIDVKPVNTYWDLGRSDMTSIWFVQSLGYEHHIIDFYENRGQPLSHYLKVLQSKGYLWGEHWLPHDAKHELLASDKTIQQQMEAAGFKTRITPNIRIADGINAVRDIFPRLYFDAARTIDGTNHLRRYRYGVDLNTGQWTKEPLHDAASHASDALRYFAVAVSEVGTDSWNKPLKVNIGWVA